MTDSNVTFWALGAIPIVVSALSYGVKMLLRGELVTASQRDRELLAKDALLAQQKEMLERIVADVTRDRDALQRAIDRMMSVNEQMPQHIEHAVDVFEASVDYAQRRALMRPPFKPPSQP